MHLGEDRGLVLGDVDDARAVRLDMRRGHPAEGRERLPGGRRVLHLGLGAHPRQPLLARHRAHVPREAGERLRVQRLRADRSAGGVADAPRHPPALREQDLRRRTRHGSRASMRQPLGALMVAHALVWR